MTQPIRILELVGSCYLIAFEGKAREKEKPQLLTDEKWKRCVHMTAVVLLKFNNNMHFTVTVEEHQGRRNTDHEIYVTMATVKCNLHLKLKLEFRRAANHTEAQLLYQI